MINKVLFVGAIALAAIGAATAPAFAGLSGNPSFSHSVPVRVPAQAQVVHFDDHGHAKSTAPTASAPTSSVAPTSIVRPSEPGDDRGTDATSSAPRSSDDHGGARPTTSTSPRSTEPGDDHGGHGEATEPGDDHGGKHGGHQEPGDDNGHGGGN